jgi:hypothetical protein
MIAELVAKRCTGCQEIKPVRAYRRNTGKGDGLTSRCSGCLSARDRERRPEKYRPATCEPCRDRRHGRACLGVYAICGCRCRPTLGLEGPFEFGDPTVPFTREAFVD